MPKTIRASIDQKRGLKNKIQWLTWIFEKVLNTLSLIVNGIKAEVQLTREA
jgi:hypothetical protein